MAGVNGQLGMSTSPNSSEDLDSNLATPATKVSNLSPSDIRETFKVGTTGIVRSKVPPAFILTQSPQRQGQGNDLHHVSTYAPQDPFVSGPGLSATTQSSTDTSKLSPIASSFTPQSVLTSNSVSSVALSTQLSESLSKLVGYPASTGLPLSPGVLSSTGNRSDAGFGPSSPALYENLNQEFELSVGKKFRHGSFSTDNGAFRCLVVGQVATDCPAAAIEGFFSVSDHDLKGVK